MKVAVDVLPGLSSGVGRWQRESVRVLSGPDFSEITKVTVFAFEKRPDRPAWVPTAAEYKKARLPGRAQGFLANRLGLPVELVCGLGRPDVILGLTLHSFPTRVPFVLGVADVSWRTFSGQYRTIFNSLQISRAERAIRDADQILTLSQGSADELIRGGVPASRISIAHLGVGEEFQNVLARDVQRVRELYGLPDRFALYLGGINERKNIGVLAAAVESLGGMIPLVLAGPLPSEPLSYWGLDKPWIRHVGYIAEADLPALYAAAVVKVFPSKLEGYGLPLIEAMAAGTPVLAADTPVFREVGGDAACFFSPDDPAELAGLLRAAFASNNFLQEYRGRGLALVARRTWRAYGECLVAALRTAVERRGLGR